MKKTDLQIEISNILKEYGTSENAVKKIERLCIAYCLDKTKWSVLGETFPPYDEFVLFKRFDGICFVDHLDKDISLQEFIDKTGATHWRYIEIHN